MNEFTRLIQEYQKKFDHKEMFMETMHNCNLNLELIYERYQKWGLKDGQTMYFIDHGDWGVESYVDDHLRGEDVPYMIMTRNGEEINIKNLKDGKEFSCPLKVISFKESELYIAKPSEEENERSSTQIS